MCVCCVCIFCTRPGTCSYTHMHTHTHTTLPCPPGTPCTVQQWGCTGWNPVPPMPCWWGDRSWPLLYFLYLCCFACCLGMPGRMFDLLRWSSFVWDLVCPFGFDHFRLSTLRSGYFFWCYSIAAYSRCGACPWFSAYQVLLVCVPSLIGFRPFS